MKCVICKQGGTRPERVTATLERGTATLLAKQVPVDVCENCQEFYLSSEVTHRVMGQAEEVVQPGAELEVIAYAA